MIDWSWQSLAACAHDDDPGAWFASKGEPGRRAHAVEVCFSCPVREECLVSALVLDSRVGVWGGQTTNERRRTQRERVNA